ncbi:MAG TPA: tetratricopeptide repeat protein [Candidatus Obscuribacterales bacterium]
MLLELYILSALSGWRDLDANAQAALKEGDLDRAEALWKDAVRQAEGASAVDPGLVDCLIGLALVNDRRGIKAESERLYELAMRNVEGVAGDKSPRFANRLPELARLYAEHGKARHAEILYQKALKIREETAGKESIPVAAALEMYAAFLKREGRGAEAEKLETRARSIRDANRL